MNEKRVERKGNWVNWGLFKLFEMENPNGKEPFFVLEKTFLMKGERPKSFVIPQESLLELDSERVLEFRYCKRGKSQ